MLKAQTPSLWHRQLQSVRHHSDDYESSAMTKEHYLRIYSVVLPKSLLVSLWMLINPWAERFTVPENPWEFFVIGKVYACLVTRT